jgi:hypothetical protein
LSLVAAFTPPVWATGSKTIINTLDCGQSHAAMRSICNASGDIACSSQSMIVTYNDKEGQHQRNVPLSWRKSSQPQTLIDSWACVTAPTGKAYYVLSWSCLIGSASCSDEDSSEQLLQVISPSGRDLDAGHTLKSNAHNALMQKLGIESLLNNQSIKLNGLNL